MDETVRSLSAPDGPAPLDVKAHWESIHEENGPGDVSWYQATPAMSLALIERLAISGDAHILDVGCGQWGLAAALTERGFTRITAMDVSAEALRRARQALGPKAEGVEWVEADVREFVSRSPVDLWHDRAVLHFFTTSADQARYVESVRRNVSRGGHVVLAGFALDGPEKCSGLPVVRRDAQGIASLLGPDFVLKEGTHEVHSTPWGKKQAFQWAAFQRR